MDPAADSAASARSALQSSDSNSANPPTPSSPAHRTAFHTPLQSPLPADKDGISGRILSPALPVGASVNGDNAADNPPRRRSVQFDRSAQSDPNSPAIESPPPTSADKAHARQKLKTRMRSFGLPVRPGIHRRTKSNMSTYGSTLDEPRSDGDIVDGEDVDGDFGGPEALSPATPDATRRRRLVLPDWMSSPRGAQTEPNTPMNGDFSDSLISPDALRARSRPRAPSRRATMNDIPEGMSEDEGRARLAGSPGWRRRSAAWLQTAQSPSFVAARRKQRQEEAADKTSRNGAGRRHRRIVSGTGADGSSSGVRFRNEPGHRFRQIVANIKAMAAKRRAERGIDYSKSAELMGELLAGSPAAIILASHFQRDESFKRKVPVLLEQLKLKITDSERVDDSRERHLKFRIELEYGNGLMRMRWTVWRYLSDFLNLHARYTAFPNVRRKGTINTVPGKLPKFPKSAFPILRGMRAFAFLEEDDDENKELSSPPPESAPVTPYTPRRPTGHARRYSSHIRSTSGAGPSYNADGTLADSAARREAFPENQRRVLEIYLRQMIRHFTFRAGSNRLCQFLEISALGVNLAAEGGYHGKEGMLSERKGNALHKAHTEKWFLVRQSYIACVESPEETVLSDVFLVDADFKLVSKRPRIRDQKGAKEKARTAKNSAAHPQHHRLKLWNSERQLTLAANSDRVQEQFAESIEYMVKNTEWSKRHRFDSFAPLRENVFAEWLVDGRDYMWKVSRAISMAENVIYIHDWWLSPETYLRRPPAISHKWRLDRLLQKKAQEGVKIYIIMYRNINSAIPIDSEYSKMSLLDLHPNIYVQRSPNQVRQNVFFWAHHEKICVVDHIVGFCGGVDLCFGRWDTPEHRVVDDKRTGHEPEDFPRDADHCQLWPGKDYSNPRVQDFFKLDEPYGEMYDRTKVPRMPWHDIGMQVVGQPARDLTRHFVQRWNFLLRQRTPKRPIPVLLPPPDFNPEDLENLGFSGTCNIQMLRSASEWSLGTPGKVEHSIMNAYVKLIEQSDHFVYIENQFFISSCWVEGTQIQNLIGDALVERIIRAHENGEDWLAIVVIPLMPGFQNLVHETDGTSVRLIMQCQYRSICRGERSIFGRLRAAGIEPTEYIQFYSLRQWGKIGPEKALTSEQLYIHAKCMVVDDRHAIIGSANINERSMLGSRDSEVAAVVYDKDMVEGVMAGRPYKVGRFPHSLRMRLMREHLGIDVDGLREAEIDTYFRDDPDAASMDGSYNSDSPDSSDGINASLDGSWKRRRPTRYAGQHLQTPDDGSVDDSHGRDSVMLRGNREVLVNSHHAEGKGSLQAPKRPLAGADDAPHGSSRPGFPDLPPATVPRMHTQELGLTLLSQLPPLPTTDDTDIGGPSIPGQPGLSPADIQRPLVTDDCMKDPISDAFFLQIWHQVAENNTRLYRRVFRCMPDNEATDWATYWEFTEYAKQFSAMQGVGAPATRESRAPSRTGPPGVGLEQVGVSIKETLKEQALANAEANAHGSRPTLSANPSATRDGSAPSTTGAGRDAEEALNEKTGLAEPHNGVTHVDFAAPPSKEGESPADEKKATLQPAGSSTRRRRRTTTKPGSGMRGSEPILGKEEAEQVLDMIQGHLVVFPYDWLCKEEESSKWLYGVDQMAPLEIYD